VSPAPVLVAVVDIGTNSTRLLIADVDALSGRVIELDRRTTVTRLGQGVDQTGELAEEAMARVLATLDEYQTVIEGCQVEAAIAVLTSAVRDASNGAEFARRVSERHGLEARTITGDEEARLTFLGATSERPRDAPQPVVVIDIGGGSTELVVGATHGVTFHVSTQAGVVRHTERHLRHDPPRPDELQELAADVRRTFADVAPAAVRESVAAGIAVAGTPTSLAAIEQALEPYDPTKVHGYRLSLGVCDMLLARLATMSEEQRREVAGLHPARAPTIVAGVVMLVEAMRAFGLDDVTVSEHDILHGAALRLAGAAPGASTFV
jgi:exopolyphosphatase / guanosine-5'-triphosphate,3'-diphosphate pyrophosphatase